MDSLKKELRFLTGMLLLTTSIYTQEINVGDRIDIENLISASSEIPAEQLKGKWILLDFWSHTCIVCLQSFPELEALQKKFADQIQIVLVNRESKDSTDRFFSKEKSYTVQVFRLFPATPVCINVSSIMQCPTTFGLMRKIRYDL